MEEIKVSKLEEDKIKPTITPTLGSALLTYHQVKLKSIGFTQIEQSNFMGVMALSVRFLIETYTTPEQKFVKLIYLKSGIDSLVERIQEVSHKQDSIENKREGLPELERLSQCLNSLTKALEGLS